MMGYLGADSQLKMLWLSLSFLIYFGLGPQKGTFFGVEVVFRVTISEAVQHPFKGQEDGLEITGQPHLRMNDSQLKSGLTLATDQYQGWPGNRGESRVIDFGLHVCLWGRRKTQGYTLLAAGTGLRPRQDRPLLGSTLDSSTW